MAAPLLSVIIPTYNAGDTLRPCLNSIVDQTFKDLEILIVDGGSTDQTLVIARQIAESYVNLKITSEPDSGIYDAMNKGIRKAKGKWLYFLGSDDSLLANHILESIFKITINVDIIYGNVYNKGLKRIYDGEFDWKKLLTQNICHQAIFFRHEVFSITGMFNTRYKAHADWDHNLKWFANRQIEKQYIPVVIATFADGGLSSHYRDERFEELLHWKRLKNNKDTISRLNRLRMLKASLKKLMILRGYRLMAMELIESLSLLF